MQPKIFLSCYCFLVYLVIATSCNSQKNKSASVTSVDQEENRDLAKKYGLQKIKLPIGFSLEVYAEVDGARSLTISPAGVVYVGSRNAGNVYAIKDVNNDRKADSIYTLVRDLESPNGVAFKDGDLYIATISKILKIADVENQLASSPTPTVIYDKLPTDGHHGWKFIAFGPDGKLYVPVGAPCNICESENPVYASLTRMNADGSGFEIFARGIRNTVGFTWHPQTSNLWFTDNGRDQLGDDVPNDELNIASKAGMHFGYPYCHQGNIADPELGKKKNCDQFTSPVKFLGPHVAALGLRFNVGHMFPPEYSNALFIARHGSWNRSSPIGYDVAVIKMKADGTPGEPEPFISGFLENGKKVHGRPVDLVFQKDGSMLLSDDYNGVVYRISYDKNTINQ